MQSAGTHLIELRLLGQFDLRLDGRPVEIPSRPAQSLLAYLALTGGVAHRRERLAGLIWPDVLEADARRNLRRALWHIRKALEGRAPLRADDITIAFDAGPETRVDASVISQKLSPERTTEELIQAVSAYGGELLPGFYDEWIIVERERLQSAFEARIKLLLDRLVEARRWEDVLKWGKKWIALAGAAEPAYRALMIAYSGQGDLAGVGHTYQRCVEVLSRDLGVEPSVETSQLFTQLSHLAQTQEPRSEAQQFQIPEEIKPFGRFARLVEPGEPAQLEEPDTQPPYKGLQFFDQIDADLFFGREALTNRLLQRLGLSQDSPSDDHSLLVIVGASGSGKSSLLRAGLAPAIRRSAAPDVQLGVSQSPAWEIVVVTPTAHPLEVLATRLTRQVESVTAAATLLDDMRGDSRSLRLYLRNAARPLILMVDQMEELFTLCRDERERQDFVDNLLAAAESEQCKIVLALRADFYPHCAHFENLRLALATCQEYIGLMNAAELRSAIEGPANYYKYVFEPGLVDLILREVGDEPGSLPLLSHALLETWKRRQGRTLTLAGYAEAGGVHGAIAHTAERLYLRLTEPQQRITRNIFIRLTELGEGVQDTRRRVSPDELVLRAEDRLSVAEVLDLLVNARLVTLGEDSVEVAHEALIREWPTLRSWLSEDRDGLRLHRHLTEAARSWEELDCDLGELYRGARLAQATDWFTGHLNELNDLERDFLVASQALSEQEAAEREAAHQREVEAALRFAETEQRRAEEQSRTVNRFRWLATGLALLLLAAVALANFALQQRNRIEAQVRLATSRELAASALDNLDVDPERSILLSLQALQSSYTQEAENALHRSVQSSRIIKVFKTEYQWATRMAVSPDGQRLAVTSTSLTNEFVTEIWDINRGDRLLALPGELAVSDWTDSQQLATVAVGEDGDAEIIFWDTHTGQVLLSIPRKYLSSHEVLERDLSPDRKLIAESLIDGTTIVSKLDTGERLLILGKPGGPQNWNVAFSRDGNRLAATVNNILRIWEISSGREVVTLPSSEFGTRAAEFAPQQNQIALGIGPVVKIVDTDTGRTLLTLSKHTGFVQGLRYHPYGGLLATAGADSLAIIWDSATGEALMTLSGHTGPLVDLAFIPGHQLATSSFDGTVRIWDISPAGNSEAAGSFDFNNRTYTSIAFSSDGKRLAVSGGSTGGEIFDAATGQRLISLGGKFGNWQGSADFSPDGKFLAITNGEDTAAIVDAASGQRLLSLHGHRAWIGDLAYSPDGKLLATIGFDGYVKMWDSVTGEELFTLQAFSENLDTTQNIGIEFSPDGSRFATAGGHKPKVWETATGKEVLDLPSQVENVSSVAFNPDGKQLAVGVALGVGASLWDLSSGHKLAEFTGHQGSVVAILFSLDGKQVITGSVDGTIKIWEASTGLEQANLTRQPSQITGLALSPDGNRLAASNSNGTARVYLLRIEDLVYYARHRLTRWFTLEECLIYLHSETCPIRSW